MTQTSIVFQSLGKSYQLPTLCTKHWFFFTINLISIYYNYITHKLNAMRNGCLTHNSDMCTDQHYLFYDLWEEERSYATKFKRKTHCDKRRIKGK